VDLDALFLGKHFPFVAPLAGLCGSETHPARYSYVSIGFQHLCKIVLVPRAPEQQYNYRTNSYGRKIPHIYYQITYRKFQPDTQVQRFLWNLEQKESDALAKAQSVWNNAGMSPWSAFEDMKENEIKVDVEPKSSTPLFDIVDSGVIYGLELFAENPDDLWLEMYWDGSANPDVNVPLGPFFACSSSEKPKRDVRGLWAGFTKDLYYCYLPMPFRKAAKIQIKSQAKKKVSIAARLRYRTEVPSNTDGLFCAHRYDHLSPPVGRNYTVLDIKDRGHFVGLVMDRPGHMEGDDFFFVDGEKQPSIHGTGTEDFFNFAWGLSHTGSLALHGITIQANAPICYRIHLPAAVPFSDSLLVNWEHGHDTQKGPNLHKGRYSGVVYYYRSRVP
ncbi:MAG: glycoside hydrolase family 172 protein, partial [Planctomycetota bacterium]